METNNAIQSNILELTSQQDLVYLGQETSVEHLRESTKFKLKRISTRKVIILSRCYNIFLCVYWFELFRFLIRAIFFLQHLIFLCLVDVLFSGGLFCQTAGLLFGYLNVPCSNKCVLNVLNNVLSYRCFSRFNSKYLYLVLILLLTNVLIKFKYILEEEK